MRRQSTADGWQKKAAGRRSWVPGWRSVSGGNVVMSGKMIGVIRGSRIDVAGRLVVKRPAVKMAGTARVDAMRIDASNEMIIGAMAVTTVDTKMIGATSGTWIADVMTRTIDDEKVTGAIRG